MPRLLSRVIPSALLAWAMQGHGAAVEELPGTPIPPSQAPNGVLTFTKGPSISAPGGEWHWRYTRVNAIDVYLCVKPGSSTMITVFRQSIPTLTDEFMRGFVKGSVERSVVRGERFEDSAFERVDKPEAGSYRYRAQVVHAGATTLNRTGYVLPSGFVITASHQGADEPPELVALVKSYRQRE